MAENLDEELKKVAVEIRKSEQKKKAKIDELNQNISIDGNGIRVFKAEDVKACQDFLLYCELNPEIDIRLEYGGKLYNKEEITEDFLKAEANKALANLSKESDLEAPDVSPKIDERRALEASLTNAIGAKAKLSKTLQELDEERKGLEEQCQASGKVLPSDQIETTKDGEEK